jgi:diguanylate cyclase (GGDEF)-like protein
MEEVLDTVVDISAKGLQADVAGALVFDEKTGFLTVAGLRGMTGEEREVINSTTFSPGEGILGEVFVRKKTQNFLDLSTERPGSSPFNGRIKAFLATPLSTDGYEVGVLFLGKFIKEPFSPSAEEFIETISAQAAIAVENARLYSQAQELAIHNGLTGIYNYRYFMKQLDEEIKRAERYGRSVALMMIDIDLFKHVNDSFGHQRGDEVLRGLASTLVNATRETDVVARYGGEEFCVILPETDLEAALEVAEKLRASVAKASYAREKGNSIKITISIGVASYPGVAGNQEDLLRKADDALYAAKTKRNMVVSAGTGNKPVK